MPSMNSEVGSWEIPVKKPASKNLRAAPHAERERLLSALAEMEIDPFSGDIARLKNEITTVRRRVGNWRIFFDVNIEARIVEVPLIKRRSTTTYGKRR